jgi:hypothetical protein
MSDAATELEKLAAGLHKAHYYVEDVRAAFVAGAHWGITPLSWSDVSERESKEAAARRYPDKEEDSHDK